MDQGFTNFKNLLFIAALFPQLALKISTGLISHLSVPLVLPPCLSFSMDLPAHPSLSPSASASLRWPERPLPLGWGCTKCCSRSQSCAFALWSRLCRPHLEPGSFLKTAPKLGYSFPSAEGTLPVQRAYPCPRRCSIQWLEALLTLEGQRRVCQPRQPSRLSGKLRGSFRLYADLSISNRSHSPWERPVWKPGLCLCSFLAPETPSSGLGAAQHPGGWMRVWPSSVFWRLWSACVWCSPIPPQSLRMMKSCGRAQSSLFHLRERKQTVC